jgi:hypothetical protein
LRRAHVTAVGRTVVEPDHHSEFLDHVLHCQ